jgi:branched-chain amino acid transport system ATP-binding protein
VILNEPLITIQGATKRFGALAAVNNVSLAVRPGEIVGLIGPNGSGKSTLINLISGAMSADAGEIRLGQHDATRWSAQRRCHWGIGRTRQIARPLGNMTVYENVLVGALFGSTAYQSYAHARRLASAVIEEIGLAPFAATRPVDLPIQKLKLLEMARALATQPRVLLLDETIAGLSAGEAAFVLNLVSRKRDAGLGVVFIEHRLPEVIRMSDRIVVLNYGEVLAEGEPQEVANNPAVLRTYLGVAA